MKYLKDGNIMTIKVAIVSQIFNKNTGLGKAVNDLISSISCFKDNTVIEIDITNNKLFIKHILSILFNKIDIYYFTPSGSTMGNVRDSIYLLSMLIKRKKVVCHFHNSNFGNVVNSNFILLFLNKYIYSKIDSILILGEKQKEMFSRLDIKDYKYKIVGNGVDESLFINNDQLKDKHNNLVKNVVYFSNMIESKGYKIVLEVAKIMEKDKRYHFYFSGKFFNTQSKEEFLRDIKNMSNVTYIDGVYGKDKEKLLKKMNVFILPSSYKDETLPISMLEAIASGSYIIISDVGVISEYINKKTSILLDKNELNGNFIASLLDEKYYNFQNLDYNISYYKNNFTNKKIQKKIIRIILS